MTIINKRIDDVPVGMVVTDWFIFSLYRMAITIPVSIAQSPS